MPSRSLVASGLAIAALVAPAAVLAAPGAYEVWRPGEASGCMLDLTTLPDAQGRLAVTVAPGCRGFAAAARYWAGSGDGVALLNARGEALAQFRPGADGRLTGASGARLTALGANAPVPAPVAPPTRVATIQPVPTASAPAAPARTAPAPRAAAPAAVLAAPVAAAAAAPATVRRVTTSARPAQIAAAPAAANVRRVAVAGPTMGAAQPPAPRSSAAPTPVPAAAAPAPTATAMLPRRAPAPAAAPVRSEPTPAPRVAEAAPRPAPAPAAAPPRAEPPAAPRGAAATPAPAPARPAARPARAEAAGAPRNRTELRITNAVWAMECAFRITSAQDGKGGLAPTDACSRDWASRGIAGWVANGPRLSLTDAAGAEVVGVTPRAALRLVEELGLREMTGRGRFRAWGIL